MVAWTTKKVHNLRIRGEIEGKDADVYVDDVSVSLEPDIIVNGSIDAKPSATNWTIENIDEKWGGYKTEKLKDGTTNGYMWINFGGQKDKDPAIVQTMKNLKPGKTYIVSCQYRTGNDSPLKEIKPGTPMLAIDIDGKEIGRAYAASAKGDPKKLDMVSWNSSTAKFKATKAAHVVKIRAEIDGFDGDVDLDNISVIQID